jgi:hypothetical protein
LKLRKDENMSNTTVDPRDEATEAATNPLTIVVGGTESATASVASAIAAGDPLVNIFEQFEKTLIGLIQPAVTAAAGPIAGEIAGVGATEVEPIASAAIARWIGGLYKHIGVPMDADLSELFEKVMVKL